MNKDKRDELDELFRSKLYDYEPDDDLGVAWSDIESQLPNKSIPLRRNYTRYWIAAAIAILLISSIGVYFFNSPEKEVLLAVEQPSTITHEALPSSTESTEQVKQAESLDKQSQPLMAEAPLKTYSPSALTDLQEKPSTYIANTLLPKDKNQLPTYATATSTVTSPSPIKIDLERLGGQAISGDLVADASIGEKQKVKRWGFGTGFGGNTVSSSGSVLGVVTNSSVLTAGVIDYIDKHMLVPELKSGEQRKTNIKHRTPISTGLSVSYFLNERWSLQSGLTYTYLRSSWETNGLPKSKTVQKLHYIGIPLAVSYKIAEWNRFNFYASMGAMAEMNVAGTLKLDSEIQRETESIRSKDIQWSLNGRVGVSYPIWRFISAFGEVGASYHFDTGSALETIRTDKPFNVGLQFGLRFGF